MTVLVGGGPCFLQHKVREEEFCEVALKIYFTIVIGMFFSKNLVRLD